MPSRPSRGRTRHILRVPILEDDAVERKRVLNILAQRRYRERKREGKGAGRSVEGVQQNRKSGEVGRSTPPNDSPKDRVGTQEAAEGVEMPLLHHTSESALEYWIEQGMQPDVHSMSDAWLWPENTPLDDMLFSASDLDFSVPFPPSSAAGTALSSILQEHQTSTTSFPDTYLLPVPALGLLRACLAIATRLGVEKLIWDFGALSPFYSPSNSTSLSSLSEAFPSSSSGVSESVPFSSIGSGIDEMTLPENMRPTLTQRLLPHHPLLDILPWPSVRDKLIMLFSQAQDVMPSELNLGQFVADAEDSADGVRIAGDNPFDAKGWQVGDAITARWWFALDGEVVRRR